MVDEKSFCALRSRDAQAVTVKPFQERVAEAHVALFHDDPTDLSERRDRFYEEATETVQALGMTEDEAHQLVAYTFSRPPGAPEKEIGAAGLTLASMCVVGGWDMQACMEADLADLQTPEKIAKVRAKRATRHGRGVLPGLSAPPPAQAAFIETRNESAGFTEYVLADETTVSRSVNGELLMSLDRTRVVGFRAYDAPRAQAAGGEVERYSLNIPTAQMYADKNGLFVLASSYDALAAAKDAELTELHERIYRAETNRDDWRERAEAAERQRDALREALRDLADAARSATDARKHTPLINALANADALRSEAEGGE